MSLWCRSSGGRWRVGWLRLWPSTHMVSVPLDPWIHRGAGCLEQAAGKDGLDGILVGGGQVDEEESEHGEVEKSPLATTPSSPMSNDRRIVSAATV
jgi:hypothetical protein